MPGFVQFYSTFAGGPPARAVAPGRPTCPASLAGWSAATSGTGAPAFRCAQCGLRLDGSIVVAPEVRHRQRPPQGGRHLGVPGLRPLRRVVVPGARIEVAEFLVLELV